MSKGWFRCFLIMRRLRGECWRPQHGKKHACNAGGHVRRLWTIVGVGDVARSFAWYQTLLGLLPTAPAHDYFGQILDTDGTVLLCLHAWGDHEHPPLTAPSHASHGDGLLLFFRVDDFHEAVSRARALVRGLREEPHLNPSTGTLEFCLLDLDGYFVTISALSAA